MNEGATWQVGTALPELIVGPLTPADFARYAEASSDHNPLHTDPTFAQAAGLEGVIAHGMLVMGLLGRLATSLAGPTALHEFGVRFRAPTRPGETLCCGGQITASVPTPDGQLRLKLDLWARGDADQLKATGSCWVLLRSEQ
ncbi:MAG: MaoC/PaaZ C-terminal domain-containing protein [Oscillochloridaceae bacterium umkhey_bin13]